jgi:NADPH:quinone reductase-like Zn-dependent oxidoreductase
MHASNPTLEPVMSRATGRAMRAVLHSRYGAPDVLELAELDRPVPGDEDVLVRVLAAGASVGDHHVVTGKPYLIRLSPYGGLPSPRNRIPGTSLAGRIESVGAKVTSFRLGDEVCGSVVSGAFAEYVAVSAKSIALKPTNLSFEEAAAVPWAVTAVQGLRTGEIQAGQRVLINGASGGVGTWAVQIAKAHGAEVTGVCSARNVEMVRALGADHVIDYAKENFADGGPRFDLMLDLIGNRPVGECRRALTVRGVYVACAGGGGDWVGPLFRLGSLLATSLFASQKLRTFVSSPDAEDLSFLKGLIEAGKAKPVIERSYALTEVSDALAHVGAGHARGQSVLRIADS